MLPNPPCIPGLIGCGRRSEGTAGILSMSLNGELGEPLGSSWDDESPESTPSVVLSEASSGTGFGASTSDDEPEGARSGSSSSSSRSSRLVAQTYGSSSSRSSSSSAGPRKVVYTITVKNKGDRELPRVKVKHDGPGFSVFTFDQDRSTSGCTQVSKDIECTLSLAAGESKDVVVAYSASGGTNCDRYRSLLSARATSAETEGGTYRTHFSLETTVRCEVQPESAMSSSSPSTYLPPPSPQNIPGMAPQIPYAPGTNPQMQAGPQMPAYGTQGDQNLFAQSLGEFGKPSEFKPGEFKPGFKGYKPYDVPRRPPQSGAHQGSYALAKSDFVLVDKGQPVTENSLALILTIVVVSIFLLGGTAYVSLCRRKP